MVFYSFYSIDMKSCSLISLGGNSKESFWQSQRVLLKMAPSTRVYNIFLPRWFRHFTKAAEEQEAEATRNRADSFWLAGLLLESGSWRLKMQFLMGVGGWASKTEDQNSLVGLSWYLKWKKKNKWRLLHWVHWSPLQDHPKPGRKQITVLCLQCAACDNLCLVWPREADRLATPWRDPTPLQTGSPKHVRPSSRLEVRSVMGKSAF